MNMNKKPLSEEEIDILIRQLLNIGEAMYRSGAEIHRIEIALRKLGIAYGAEHVNVFAITSSIVLTIEFPERPAMTQSRRIRLRDSTDLTKLKHLIELCRSCTENPLPVTKLKEQTLAILAAKPSAAFEFAGELFAAGGFTIFFGGTLCDAVAACICVCFIFFLQRFLHPLCSGQIYFNAITSFLIGIMICIGHFFFPCLHIDMIMIGDIMVLIPGIAITNSIRYTFSGDSISGIEKLLDSLLQALAIALGFTIALMLNQRFF